MNFLAFDCGATSGRAVLATFEQGKFSMKEVYRFPTVIRREDGKMYWELMGMYDHFVTCLTQLGSEGVKIDSIGIDTWGVDFGCIGEDGSLVRLPRSYRDPYTQGVPEQVFGIVPRSEVYGITGIQIMDFNTIFQLYAQSREKDSALKKAKAILFMPDLLSYLLTGNMVCEYTDASTSGMMNQRTRQFEKPLLEKIGVDPSVLLDIVQPGTEVGTLKPELAERTGLGAVPVIAVAGHDTASAIAAVPAADEHFAYLSSGTWSLMGIESPEPIINEESARLNFTNEGGIEGTTRFLKNITGMWLLEQCRKVWENEGRTYNYAQITEMAKASASYKETVDPDDPRLASPTNMVEAINTILAEKGASLPKSDGEMISCIFNSLAQKYKEVIGLLQSFASFKIEKLHVIGGGSANDLMSQMTADAIGMPVVAGPVEATAIGNVMIQAKAAGLVGDRWQMRKLIADAFAVKTFNPQK